MKTLVIFFYVFQNGTRYTTLSKYEFNWGFYSKYIGLKYYQVEVDFKGCFARVFYTKFFYTYILVLKPA